MRDSENYSKNQVFALTNGSIVPLHIIYRVKTRFSKKDMLYLTMAKMVKTIFITMTTHFKGLKNIYKIMHSFCRAQKLRQIGGLTPEQNR